MKVVILAAGKGIRLSPYSKVLPKPLMPIEVGKEGCFVSIMERILGQVKRLKVSEVIIVLHYFAEMVMKYLGDGSKFDLKITYCFQEVLDGNGGAFYQAQHLFGESDVMLMDCDNYLLEEDVFVKLQNTYLEKKSDLSIMVAHVDNVKKFAIIKCNDEGYPIDIYEKPKDSSEWGNLAKGGVMLLSNRLAMLSKEIAKTEHDEYTTTQIVKYAISNQYAISFFEPRGGFKDIGTWDEYLPILRENIKNLF